MSQSSGRRPDAAIGLCVTLTQWNLGVLVALSLAFGGALAKLYQEVKDAKHQVETVDQKVATVDRKMNAILYLIGVAPEGMNSGSYGQERHGLGPAGPGGADAGWRRAGAPALARGRAAGPDSLAGGAAGQ